MTWDRGDDDGIGYGRPPKYTRFKKGKSGNPNGRPPRKKEPEVPPGNEFDDDLRKLNARKLKIKRDGKEQTVSAIVAVAMKQQAAALGGNVPAARDVLRAGEKLSERDAMRKKEAAREAEASARLDREVEIRLYEQRKSQHAKQTTVYADAIANGRDPEPRYPHPEDFWFDHENRRATIMGPWNEGHALHYRKLGKHRDFHLLDHIVLTRQRPRASEFKRNLAICQLAGIDSLLPKHQRLCDKDMSVTLEYLFTMPMAELRQWREEVRFWLSLNPLSEPSKKGKREVYQAVNKAMAPVLKPMGYRSLAEFENAYDEHEGNPPWPKSKAA